MLKKKKIKLNFGSITAKFTNFGEQFANFRSKRKFGEIFGASPAVKFRKLVDEPKRKPAA